MSNITFVLISDINDYILQSLTINILSLVSAGYQHMSAARYTEFDIIDDN